MTGALLRFLALAAAASAGAAAERPAAPPPAAIPGVANPREAHIDYMLKCQGCHRPDGVGDAVSNPPLRDSVARFLHVSGGRAFLGRVPGVSMVDLDDRRTAQVLNWTLYRFDRAHIPAGFAPYTAAEIHRLRADPIRLDRLALRNRLVSQMEGLKGQ